MVSPLFCVYAEKSAPLLGFCNVYTFGVCVNLHTDVVHMPPSCIERALQPYTNSEMCRR